MRLCREASGASAFCSRRLLLSLAFAALLSSLVYYFMRPAHENAMGDDRPSELMLGGSREPECTQDTGSSCYLGFCPEFSNAQCVRNSCVCPPGQCSVDGQCIRPSWMLKGDSHAGVSHQPVKGQENWTALVLSGGGAKGVFELGVLEGICSTKSLEYLRSWSMIVGTSIGAMNAAALAQFSPEEQCSEALKATSNFWDNIQDTEDIWVSSNYADPLDNSLYRAAVARHPCMLYRNLGSLSLAFEDQGGFCDPSPGRDVFNVAVSDERIRHSGTALRVVATSLRTGLAHWWNETSKDIKQGALASGALAPVVYPMEVAGDTYIDGGFVANTPILKALEEGAKRVVVVMLDPISSSGLINNITKLKENRSDLGFAILNAEYNIMIRRYFIEHELFESCFMYPDREILAYVPPTIPGALTDFKKSALRRMRRAGYDLTQEGPPVDICQQVFPNKDRFSLLAREEKHDSRPLARQRAEAKAAMKPDALAAKKAREAARMTAAAAREDEESMQHHYKYLRAQQVQEGRSREGIDDFFDGLARPLLVLCLTQVGFALTGCWTIWSWICSRIRKPEAENYCLLV